MPRTKEAIGIRPYDVERLIKDMAVGGKSDKELAAEYEVAEQTIRIRRMRHRDQINAIIQGWSDEWDHIYSTRKLNRIRFLDERLWEYQELIDQLYEEARRATEAMRNLDPNAAEVLVNPKVFNSYHDRQEKILRDIADELGQLMSRAQHDAGTSKHLTHTVEGIDLAKAMGLVKDAVEPTPAPAPELEKDTEPMRELFRAGPPAPISDPEPSVEQPVEVEAAPDVPVLPDSTVRTAKTIGEQVWSNGTVPREKYRQMGGNNPDIDQAIDHAIQMQWVAESGSALVKGAVSPRPMEEMPSERNRAWNRLRSL